MPRPYEEEEEDTCANMYVGKVLPLLGGEDLFVLKDPIEGLVTCLVDTKQEAMAGDIDLQEASRGLPGPFFLNIVRIQEYVLACPLFFVFLALAFCRFPWHLLLSIAFPAIETHMMRAYGQRKVLFDPLSLLSCHATTHSQFRVRAHAQTHTLTHWLSVHTHLPTGSLYTHTYPLALCG